MNKFDINLNLYRSFYYVAKYGGFTKASKYALISQSSLSSNIKNLENVLDTKLFERGITNIKLTNAGKELFEKLEEIANILNGSIQKQEFNIGCIRSIADNYIGDAIKLFTEKHPDIKINICFENNSDLYQMLKRDDLDILICRYPLFYKFEKYICVEKINDIENVFACSKEYYNKEASKMKDKNYTYHLILPNSSEKRRTIEQYLIDNNMNYSVDIEIPNSTLLKKLILNGTAIGYINKKYIERELANGTLICLNNFKNIPLDNLTIIYNTHINNELINDFVKSIKTTIKKTNN